MGSKAAVVDLDRPRKKTRLQWKPKLNSLAWAFAGLDCLSLARERANC